ncbi:CBS domain-containing protein [Methanolobus zinderi]|jgi:CBS domain-containing protein|uniref:CBS domain-containing protein n=1 Tax=Methanolobus zinderi TaxID=536044 RepID=A0A7D5E7J7_9EURY|nr:CBS domain-containing protein [Methanolobus zinderi]KXS42965.1 MAG: CBS domain-containing protein [Methanolobus sp. T82-4]QLC48997.1 CBS domain-containing protein [Methanolobus zinderi]
MEVREVMTEPMYIDKADTLSHALDVMEKKGTRRLLVTHNDKLLGVLTMRNITKELGTRKKGNKPASSLHVATAVSENYVKVLPDTKLDDAVTLMVKNGGVIVVFENDEILGWVTPTELLQNNNLDGYVAEVMHKNPIVAGPADRVSHVRHLMLDNNIGRVPVVEGDKLVGIVTEKDIAKAMRSFRDVVEGSKQDSRIKNLIVEDIMRIGVKTVYTNTPTSDVAKLMLDNNIGGVPVVNLEDQMVGLVTRRSIVNGLAQ